MVLVSAQRLIIYIIIFTVSLTASASGTRDRPAGSPGRALNSTRWDVPDNKSQRCCRCLKVGEVGGGWGSRGHPGRAGR